MCVSVCTGVKERHRDREREREVVEEGWKELSVEEERKVMSRVTR